ncbi:MAG: DUF4747 family protein [Nanoarchaeota archaeon]|nr:DUF4747 family protein [Nanoarchaeota archaeon]
MNNKQVYKNAVNNINMESTVLFGRIYFTPKLKHFVEKMNVPEHRKSVLLDVINWDTDINKLLIESHGNRFLEDIIWKFAGIKSDQNYIYGKLARETEKTDLIRDDTKKDYILGLTQDTDITYFLIDLEHSVIAYQSKPNMSDKRILNIISNVFNIYHSDREEITITPITDRREMINTIKTFTKLNKITINVQRTNPDSTSSSDKMDKFLRDGHIKRMLLTAYGDERGIDLKNVELIKSGIHLADEGYGKAELKGIKEDVESSIETGNIPLKSKIKIEKENDEKNIKMFIGIIKTALKKLGETYDI